MPGMYSQCKGMVERMREDVQIRLGDLFQIPVTQCNWCKYFFETRGKLCAYHENQRKMMIRGES